MKESASFCMKCGKANTLLKQSVDTADLQATAQAATQESAQAAALATPQATALPVNTTKMVTEDRAPLPRARVSFKKLLLIVIPSVLALALVVTAVVFAFQIIGNKNDTVIFADQTSSEKGNKVDSKDGDNSDLSEADDTTTAQEGKIAFLQDTLQLSVGSSVDLNTFLTTNLAADDLVWSSDRSDQVSVDSAGTIQVLTAGASAVISAKCSSDSGVLATISITSLSLEAENFVKEVADMNNGTSITTKIDIYAALYQPAARNKTLKWDGSIFYSLEDVDKTKITDGLINSYSIEKKQLTNSASGNLIEYEIYRNPNSGAVNKITSIEHMPDTTLDITDYYYTDAGQINFIFVHKATIYTPSYASPDKQGERYYFNSDVMVKWRIVDNAQVLTDYAIGENEQHNTTTSAGAKIYDSLSADIRSQYDAKEIAMINAAYNTYSIVINAKSSSSITGHVIDSAGKAVADSKVVLYSTSYNAELFATTTGSDGVYKFSVPSNAHTYKISIQKAGCVKEDLYQIEMTDQIIDLYQENVCMVIDDGISHSTQVLVTDALNVSSQTYTDGLDSKMQRLPNATINFRTGINNRTGIIYLTAQTDSEGIAKVDLASGNYTAEIISEGYASSYGTIVASADNSIAQISTTPILTGSEIRIVLTWSAVPADLDSHLFTPYNEADSTTGYHIWFGNMNDASGNKLDVDDTTSYGPETVTISGLSDGSYKYYVADYTNCSAGMTSSTDMSLSLAKVSVYTQAGLAATFYVPSNKSGVIWEVFEIRNKVIVPIQRYYSNIDDKPWWNTDK